MSHYLNEMDGNLNVTVFEYLQLSQMCKLRNRVEFHYLPANPSMKVNNNSNTNNQMSIHIVHISKNSYGALQ